MARCGDGAVAFGAALVEVADQQVGAAGVAQLAVLAQELGDGDCGGRWVVSRAWITRYTGAASSTVARWYALRHEQPVELRHPEVVCTVDRVHYFDRQAVEAFWAAWQQDVGVSLLGVSGRRAGDGQGARGGGHRREEREKAVGVALEALCAAGGFRRGLAAELAREHGGIARSWQRAVTEARARYEAEQGHGPAGTTL